MDRFFGSSSWTNLAAFLLLSSAAACAGRAAPANSTAAKAAPVAETAPPAPLEPIVELPRSPMGQLARAVVDVINSGKSAEQREFVRARFSEKALKEAPLEEWAAFLEQTWKLSGGIDVIELPPPRRPNEIRFVVRTRRGRHYSSFAVLAALGSEDRVDAIFANPKTDPAVMRAGVLTPVAMSEVEAARAITRRAEQLAAADRFSGAVLIVKRDRVLVSTAQGLAAKPSACPIVSTPSSISGR